MDYKQAGVDVEAADNLVDWLQKPQGAKSPHQERIVSGIGGFAALFRGDFPEMKKPLLVSSTDGVGTKVKLAAQFGSYRTVAQDLVAMCVNDLICTGARPLFFLDYYAVGRLDLSAAKEFLTGVRVACSEAECALIGGETAEMPGVYQGSDFDCAGFAVGVVDELKVLGKHLVKAGNLVVGIESSGFHSNGYSLLRKVFEKDLSTWKDVLLKPTHLYVRLVLQLLSQFKINAIAHITGGGMDNLVRVIPERTMIQLKGWEIPAPFREVQKRAALSPLELLRCLNCGVGLALFVDLQQAGEVIKAVEQFGFKAFVMAEVLASASAEPTWAPAEAD